MDNIENTKQLSDASYLFALIYKYKIFIAIVTFLAAAISVVVSLQLPVWYASSVNFVPPQESGAGFSSGTSGISAIMKDFGLSKVSGSSSNEYSMIVFLQSRSVVDSIIKKYDLAKVYDIPDTMFSVTRTTFINNTSVEYLDEGNYNVTVWDTDKNRAAEIANDYVYITNYFANKTYQEELAINVEYLENRIKSVDSAITATSSELALISKSSLIFSPEEQAQAASKALSDLKTAAMQYEIVYDLYNKNFGSNDPQTITAKEMYEAANNKLKEAYNKPGFIGNFALTEATPVAVNYLTKYADIEAFTKIKALLMTSLEKSLLDKKKYVNNFFIIDKAIPADRKDKPKRAFIVAGATVGASILCIFILLVINSFKLATRNAKLINIHK